MRASYARFIAHMTCLGFATTVLAQGLNSNMQQIDEEFADAIDGKNQEMAQAQQALRDCAVQDQARRNEIAQQQAEAQAQARQQQVANMTGANQHNPFSPGGGGAPGGGGLPGDIGNVINGITGNGARATKMANQELKNIGNEKAQLLDGNLEAARAKLAEVGNLQKDAGEKKIKEMRDAPIGTPNRLPAAYEKLSDAEAFKQIQGEMQYLPPPQSLAKFSEASGVVANTAMIRKACLSPTFQQMYGVGGGGFTPQQYGQQPGYGGYPGYGYGGTPDMMCYQAVMSDVTSLQNRYTRAMDNRANGTNLGNELMKSGLNQIARSLGAKAAAKNNPAHADNTGPNGQPDGIPDMSQYAQQNADLERQMCEQGARDQMNAIKQAIADLNQKRARALMNAQLMGDAAGQKGLGAPSLSSGGEGDGTAGGVVNAGGPSNLTPAAKGGLAAAGQGEGGGGAGGAAAGGGAGAGAGGNADWTFGAGGPPGIPASGPMEQPSFDVAGSGGGGGGYGAFGSGMDGLGTDPFADPNGAYGATGTGAEGEGIGDGGLLVLLARARMRLADHADQLVKRVQLDKMAANPIR